MRSPPVLIHLMKKSSLWLILRVQSGRRDLQHLRMGKYINKVSWVMLMTKRFLKREKVKHSMTQQNVSAAICAVNAHFHSVENRRRWHQTPDGRHCAFTTDPDFSIWTLNLPESHWLTPLFLPLILSLQDGGWEDWKEDFEICGQNYEIQIFPEGGREWVHKKEVWGDVQHASAAHCGGAGAVRDTGHQCAPTSIRQDMVRRENHINYLQYSRFALGLKCVFSKSILSGV